jgi:hypothetical protein
LVVNSCPPREDDRIDLDGKNLVGIDLGAFSGGFIKEIRLRNNALQDLDENLFSGLQNLERLRLEGGGRCGGRGREGERDGETELEGRWERRTSSHYFECLPLFPPLPMAT